MPAAGRRRERRGTDKTFVRPRRKGVVVAGRGLRGPRWCERGDRQGRCGSHVVLRGGRGSVGRLQHNAARRPSSLGGRSRHERAGLPPPPGTSRRKPQTKVAQRDQSGCCTARGDHSGPASSRIGLAYIV